MGHKTSMRIQSRAFQHWIISHHKRRNAPGFHIQPTCARNTMSVHPRDGGRFSSSHKEHLSWFTRTVEELWASRPDLQANVNFSSPVTLRQDLRDFSVVTTKYKRSEARLPVICLRVSLPCTKPPYVLPWHAAWYRLRAFYTAAASKEAESFSLRY